MSRIYARIVKPASILPAQTLPSAIDRKRVASGLAIGRAHEPDYDEYMRTPLAHPPTQPVQAKGDKSTRCDDPVASASGTASDRPRPAHGTTAVTGQLKVTPPDDATEMEADRVTDQVMRMLGPTTTPQHRSPDGVQRMCAACAEDTDEKAVHRKRIDQEDEIHGKLAGLSPAIGNQLAERIRGLTGSHELPASERAFFEPRFGHDFSGVRVYSSESAARVAGELNARAFTRGRDIVFGAGQYAPGTATGRRLIAHELAHVVQQGRAPDTPVQRDLATPEPTKKPPAQPALTSSQIDEAIRFNRSLYDKTRTEQIQDLIGTRMTGTWSAVDILAVADIQERYGLHKDGKVDPHTFDFLDKETRLEKLPKVDDECLLAFSVAVDAPTIGPVVAGYRTISGHFVMKAQFSKYCGCAHYVYRQFVCGHWKRIRGGVTTDLGGTFTYLPGGLTTAFKEDANTTTRALNYGHRGQANEGTNNGYFDDPGGTRANQARGCHYIGDDTPGGPDAVMSGDVFDIRVAFRGEIQRRGKVVETKHWTAINGTFPVP